MGRRNLVIDTAIPVQLRISSIRGLPLYSGLRTAIFGFMHTRVFNLCTRGKVRWLPHNEFHICRGQGYDGILHEFSSFAVLEYCMRSVTVFILECRSLIPSSLVPASHSNYNLYRKKLIYYCFDASFCNIFYISYFMSVITFFSCLCL
jgi:hypothetical protein